MNLKRIVFSLSAIAILMVIILSQNAVYAQTIYTDRRYSYYGNITSYGKK